MLEQERNHQSMLLLHRTDLAEVQAREQLLQEDDLRPLSMRLAHQRLRIPQILLKIEAAATNKNASVCA